MGEIKEKDAAARTPEETLLIESDIKGDRRTLVAGIHLCLDPPGHRADPVKVSN